MDLREEHGRIELGRRIQSAIAQAGYASLPSFAEALGCSRALIYQYVSGNVLVQLDRLCAIAELTDKPLDWFLAEDPNGAPAEVQRLEERAAELQARCDRLEAIVADERGKRLEDNGATRRSLLEALLELCRALRQTGDLHALAKAAARASDLARLLADEASLMLAHIHAGHAAFGLGQRDSADASLRAALELADALGDQRAASSARQELLRVLQAGGHLDEAREQGEMLLESGTWWSQWAARVALAAIEEQEGRLPSAEALLDEAARAITSANEPPERMHMAEVYVESNRVNITLARGRYPEAAEQSERLHELAAEAGLSEQVREATLNRAIAALRGGEAEHAEDLLARLREWAELAGDRRMAGLAAVFEAERLMRCGAPSAARGVALQAIETGNGLVNGQMVAEAELVLGMAFLADGLAADALHHLARCRDRARRLRLRRIEVAACLQHGLALAAAGEVGAEEALRESLSNAREHGYEDLTDRAAQALDEISGRSGESEQ